MPAHRQRLQTLQTFAVGKRMRNKPLTPPPPLVLQHLCAEIGVICTFGEKKVPMLDGLDGGILTFRWGKSHNGDFGLATNLALFFQGRLYSLSCVP